MKRDMKSLVFATALAVGSLGPVLASQPIFHDGIMEVIFAQDYTEVAKEELPDAIKAALGKDYAGAVVDKAYINEEGEYKLEVTLSDDTSQELYVDAEGDVV